MENFKHDQHHLEKYIQFFEKWELQDFENFVKYYDIYELTAFLPPNPSSKEKETLKNLIGTTTESGYLDYQKSNNTFELIMQWREKTGNFGDDNIFLNK
jgi:hypothetical protein